MTVLREVMQSAAQNNPTPNFMNRYNEGGMNNTTATAANMMQSIGDILQNDFATTFNYALATLGHKNLIMHQQYQPDFINVQDRSVGVGVNIPKSDILGDLDVEVKTSYSDNDYMQFTKAYNTLTAIMNFIGSGHPDWQRVNLPYFIKRWFTLGDRKIDLEKAYPEQVNTMQGMPQQPGQLPAPQPQQTMQAVEQPQEAGAGMTASQNDGGENAPIPEMAA
jgi:hypothetical protein